MRAWIQQEVLNAKALTFHVGRLPIRGSTIKKIQHAVCRVLSQKLTQVTLFNPLSGSDSLDTFLTMTSSLALCMGASLSPTASQERFLLSLLVENCHLQTTNRRDLVYSLMHVATDYDGSGIIVDYTCPESDVLISVFACHVRLHRNLAFLYLLPLRSSSLECSNLNRMPSWLPRILEVEEQPISHAINGSAAAANFICSPNALERGRSTLRVQGFRVSVVDYVSECCWSAGHPTYGQLATWVQDTVLRLCELQSIEIDIHFLGSLWIYATIAGGRDGFIFAEHTRLVEALSTLLITGRSFLAETIVCPDHVTDLKGGTVGIPDETLERVRDMCILANTLLKELSIVHFENNMVGFEQIYGISEGDELWVVLGCGMPLILRPSTTGYKFVCPIFVDDLKNGEAVAGLDPSKHPCDGDVCQEGYIVQTIEIS